MTGSRAALLIRLTNIFTLCGVFYAAFFTLVAPSREACWTLVVATFLALQTPIVWRRFRSIGVATHYLTAILFAALIAVAAATGGSPSPSMFWLITVPLAAAILDGPRGASFWLAAVVGAVVMIGAAELLGFQFLQTLSVRGLLLLRVAGIVGLAGAVFACVTLQYVHVWKANQLLHEQATRDSLTGLYNYRAMVRQLSELIPTPREGSRTYALILVDVDNLRFVNDRYGHGTGDAVLEEVARRMRSCVRVVDHVGRFGGEEFLCILPNCRVSEAMAIAEDIRAIVGASDVAVSGERIQTTVSVGVACYDVEQDEDAFGVLRRADAALCAAKVARCDRVFFAGLETEASRPVGRSEAVAT